MLIWPSIASQPPSASTPTWPSAGIACSADWYARLQPHRADPRAVEALGGVGRGRPSSRSSWPKPFTTRTPVTASSTTPATSPARCCESHCAGNIDPAQAQRHEQQRGHDRQHDHGEQRRQHQHHDERQDEQHDVADRQGEEAQQRLDQGEVGAARATRAGRWGAGRDGRSRGAAGVRRSWCAGRAARRARSGRRRTGACTTARS